MRFKISQAIATDGSVWWQLDVPLEIPTAYYSYMFMNFNLAIRIMDLLIESWHHVNTVTD